MDKAQSFPHPAYARNILEPNFEDAGRWFLKPLIAIHRAHALMLAECGILPVEECRVILIAVEGLDLGAIAETRYDGTSEDLFFYVERLLAEACGDDIAGKLHTARSRNDIDITLYRMVLREEILRIAALLASLRGRLLGIAREHRETLMPAYTHTQPAQPTVLGHYLMGVAECLERDHRRLMAAFETVNHSPLGACAITTTGFPINRHRTAKLLGFDGLQENSIGAIAATDYVTATAAAIAVMAVNIGKFVQDLLTWCSQEFGFLRVGDAWAQISSIMPQKRNPVAFEHARMMLSRTLSQSQAILTCSHNTPFGDIVDSEDDLWPLVLRSTEDARRSLDLLAATLAGAEWNVARMEQLAGSRFITVTELADTLVRDRGLTFRLAHKLVAQAVRGGGGDTPRAIIAALRAAAAEHSVVLDLDDTALFEALRPDHFVAVRSVPGGPSLKTLSGAMDRAEALLDADSRAIGDASAKIQSALAALETLVSPAFSAG